MTRESQRRGRRRGGLGAEEHPARDETDPRPQQQDPVLVGSTTHRMLRGELRAARGVAEGERPGQHDRDDDHRSRDAAGEADPHEDTGPENRTEPQQDGAGEPHLASKPDGRPPAHEPCPPHASNPTVGLMAKRRSAVVSSSETQATRSRQRSGIPERP